MTKRNTVKIVTAIVKVLVVVVATFNLPEMRDLMGENPANAALLFVVASTLKDGLTAYLDIQDDGKINGSVSFRRGFPMIAVLAASLCLFSASCSIRIDPLTGKPVVAIDPEAIVILADKAADRANEALTEEGK